MTQFISVVIPTYREAGNIPALTERLCCVLSQIGDNYEIVFVDDNSGDGTDKVLAELASSGKPVHLITRTGVRGLATAVICGFNQARGDILFCMDADLSHPPEALPDLLKELEDPDTDIVIGSRYISGGTVAHNWGPGLRLRSGAAKLVANFLVRLTDPMSGFFAIRREAFERAQNLRPLGYKILLELIVKGGLEQRVREVPIHFSPRASGRSKARLREHVFYVAHVVRLLCYKLSRKPTSAVSKKGRPHAPTS